MKKNFDVEFLEDAQEFLENLGEKERNKIYYNIKKAQYINDNELFKKLNENIWEFRTLYNSKVYRLFAFWVRSKKNETVVISTHGILKKTQKTPLKEIEKAESIREEYLKSTNDEKSK
ncbi:type II toxin-antitoxin system RelE/ParE family toxin [Daejeonella sp.]|jgi:phage-related protein|uniref:type II toxin-antitoxin system RelE/ParE family toxin n=1 Tax=Daejeonella sp. TaxID=2805397 RepID=UPI0037C0DE83